MRVTSADALARPMAKSDAQGRFELRFSPAEPTAVVLVAASGRVSAERELLGAGVFSERAEPREERTLDLGDASLPFGVPMNGVVRGTDGKPIAGALVRCTDLLATAEGRWGQRHASRALTDAHGGFVLPAAFEQANRITVAADGYYSSSLAPVAAAQPLELVLARSGFVSGRVTGGTGNLADAFGRIVAELDRDGWELFPAPDGRFRFPLRQRGRFRVVVGTDYYESTLESAYLGGPVDGLELGPVLADPREIFAVAAVDAKTGARVRAFRAGFVPSDLGGDDPEYLVNEWHAPGPDGLASIPAPGEGLESRGTLLVHAEGFAPHRASSVEWKRGGRSEARLVKESRIEGQVVGARAGEAVVGAALWLKRKRADDGEPRIFSPAGFATSGNDGAFRFDGLAAGLYEIHWAVPQSTVRASRAIAVGRGTVSRGLELLAETGSALSGTIRGLDPGVRAKVILEPASRAEDPFDFWESQTPARSREATVEPGGRYRFASLGCGEERLVLVVPAPPRCGHDLRIPLGSVDIRGKDLVRDHDVSRRRLGSLAGKLVVCGPGAPGRFVVVAVRADEEEPRPPPSYVRRRESRHWVLPSPDGTYSLPLAPAEYRVQVVDCVTGVVLHEREERTTLQGSEAKRLDLEVRVAELHVRLAGAGTEPVLAETLEIHGPKDPGEGWPRDPVVFGPGSGAPAVKLHEGAAEVVCYVPLGTVKLRVPQGATWFGRLGASWGGESRARREVEVEKEGVVEAELEVAPPPALRERRDR
jgi:hypothetical protein